MRWRWTSVCTLLRVSQKGVVRARRGRHSPVWSATVCRVAAVWLLLLLHVMRVGRRHRWCSVTLRVVVLVLNVPSVRRLLRMVHLLLLHLLLLLLLWRRRRRLLF